MLISGIYSSSAFARPRSVVVRAGQKDDRSRKGAQFEGKTRRKGRPAWMRSPYDSPLRDGNRDRLIGLLTERAAKTLMVYLMETNVNVYGWLVTFYKDNPIPKQGSWDEVSGETFLRKLLSMPIEEAKYNTGRDSLFDNVSGCGVDPRSIAQRIMEIRTQLSEEFIQELKAVTEENSLLLRETLNTSLLSSINSLDETTEASPPATSSSSAVQPQSSPATPDAKPQLPGSSSSNSLGSSNGRDRDGATAKVDVSLRPSFGPKNLKKPRNPAPPLNSSAPGHRSRSSSSEDSGSLADKAAAVAALNAALRAALPPDVLADHPDLRDNSTQQQQAEEPAGEAAAGMDAPPQQQRQQGDDEEEEQGQSMALQDMIAQLNRALDADVAVLCSFGDLEGEEAADDVALAEAPATADTEGPAQAATGPPQQQQQQPHLSAADACLAAVLPKGWGPRLGPGYSLLSAPRNNIVSTAKLVAAKGTPAAAALSSLDQAASGGTGTTSSTSSL